MRSAVSGLASADMVWPVLHIDSDNVPLVIRDAFLSALCVVSHSADESD